MKLRESDKIFVAGHRGMVGGAVARALRAAGFSNLALVARADLDLTDQRATLDFFDRERPRALVNCAAVVGGVVANRDYPGDFIGANLLMQANLFEAARRFEVEKILFMGSGCVYPRDPPLPTPEEALLTSPLEPTNQWYAVAKIAGVKTGEAYRAQFGMDVVSVMPCNLYGEGDNFDPETSHVAPALVRKFCRAREGGEKQAVVWGSGAALREFLHVDDLARACVFCCARAARIRSSMSAIKKKSRSPISPKSSPKRRVSRARLSSIARARTARRARFWIRRKCARSAGDPESNCAPGSPASANGIAKTPSARAQPTPPAGGATAHNLINAWL